MIKMFLDDERFPADNSGDWIIVLNFEQAVEHVLANGVPDFVSFDHDLGLEKSGFDFAKWLVEYDLDYNVLGSTFDYYVHSQNPIGVANIKGLLDPYLEFKNAS